MVEPASGAADGGGFDFDQSTSGSVAQYNYSHDNDGAGFLSANGPNTAVHRDNVIRYNVSEDDGRKNGHAGIQVWRQAPGLQIHHNTVFLSPTSGESAAARIYDVRGGAGGVALRDNLLVTTGGARLVRMTESDPGAVRFEGNDYWSSGGAFRVTWGTTTHGSLPGWRAATGQELSLIHI